MSHRARVSSISSRTSMSSETTTRRFSLQGLLESVPASPALPYHEYRYEKPAPERKRSIRPLIIKISLAVLGLGFAAWLGASVLHTAKQRFDFSYKSPDGEEYELVADQELPKEPTPVIVTDRAGKTRWTVSIPTSLDFPLRPNTYSNMCSQSGEISKHIMRLKNPGAPAMAAHFAYYHVDDTFMDIAEAEYQELLPSDKTRSWESEAGDKNSIGKEAEKGDNSDPNKTCATSLTFVLETQDAGFGNTLMSLWLAYGMAKKEGRAFFVDDRYWAYGKFATYFQPPRDPSCKPPPDHHRLPCPHHASHLLVSAATFRWTFGGQFADEFENPRKAGVLRQDKIFAMIRDGYEALFHLSDIDAASVEKRVNKLNTQVREEGGMVIGLHIRHGDKHPYEFQYQKSYIPIDHYVQAAEKLIDNSLDASEDVSNLEALMESSKLVVATDDPEALKDHSLADAVRAQNDIVLAGKRLDANVPKKFVDDSIGWEGGFFSDMFWGLGSTSSIRTRGVTPRSQEQEARRVPSDLAMQLRALIGRSYLMDLAVVAQSDRVICTVSSVGCRLLAVMMGWEESILRENWKNVDGDFDWKGVPW